MIQALNSSRPVSATRPLSSLQLPASVAATRPLNPTDLLQLSATGVSEAEVRTALEALEKQFGALRKPAFFNSPKIDLNEALARLKEGKGVIITQKLFGREVTDTVKSFEQLMLLDDLQGRRQDHGLAKPEWRLPLLFLGDKKIEGYNNNGEETVYLSAFEAYDQLRRDWRIVIEGKDVKPKDLAAYVVSKGWSAGQDPGLKTLERFRKLPETSWQVNGQSVSRDVAYLALISGSGNLRFGGFELKERKDFDLLMNLVANEPNQAIAPDLRARLTALKLDQFNSPDLDNYFVVYQRLSQGTALSYQGNTLSSLDEVCVYDALLGSGQPTAQLPAAQFDALRYLGQDQGLSSRNSYQAWQQLKAGESVSYRFAGGPTGEGFRLSASSLDQLVRVKQQVVAQRQRDQFRPELNEARTIFSERLPGFEQPLAQNLERSRQAAERARQDIPVQEARKAQAQRDYDETKPLRDRAYDDMKRAESTMKSAERTLQQDQRSYDWERNEYDRIQRDYDWAQRDYERASMAARRYEDLARQSDGLATSDPKNAEAHRRQAAQYRAQAQGQYAEAQRRYGDMQRLRMDLDRQRWDLDRAERQLSNSRRNYWDAKGLFDSKNNEFQREDSRLREATGRINQAESQLKLAQKTIADTDVISGLSAEAGQALASLKQLTAGLGSYDDFARERAAIQNQAQALRAVFSHPVYSSVHGKQLLNQFQPLLTLLANMERPAA